MRAERMEEKENVIREKESLESAGRDERNGEEKQHDFG